MFIGCSAKQPAPGTVPDEPHSVNRAASSFPGADEDYFHDMDGGLTLTAGRDQRPQHLDRVDRRQTTRFWDSLSTTTCRRASIFLKTLSSHPGLKFGRDNRWSYLGLVNEPCFEKATGPDPDSAACGWTSAAPTARPTRLKTSRNIPA